MKNKLLFITLFLSLFITACKSKCESYKEDNVAQIVKSIDDNFKLLDTMSYIKINFEKNNYQNTSIDTRGNTKTQKQIPQDVAKFCQKYKISDISIFNMSDQYNKKHYIIEMRHTVGQLRKNKSIIFFKNGKFLYPFRSKEKFITDDIYLIITPADIM